MSRVYLAGPMTGYPKHNFPAFHEAADGTWDLGEYDTKRGPRGFTEAHRIVFEAARKWREIRCTA